MAQILSLISYGGPYITGPLAAAIKQVKRDKHQLFSSSSSACRLCAALSQEDIGGACYGRAEEDGEDPDLEAQDGDVFDRTPPPKTIQPVDE